jgi:hypothetical protein
MFEIVMKLEREEDGRQTQLVNNERKAKGDRKSEYGRGQEKEGGRKERREGEG